MRVFKFKFFLLIVINFYVSVPKTKIQVSAGESNGSGNPTVHVKVIDSSEHKSESMQID